MYIIPKKSLKKLLYPLEGAIVYMLYYILRVLPIDTASSVCGFVMRKVGRFFKAQKIAYRNLSMCFPDISDTKKTETISDMWDNLGRTIGELPFSSTLDMKHLKQRIKCQKGFDKLPPNSILLSAHYGNFELVASVAACFGYKLHLVYRHINNPIVDRFMKNLRANNAVNMIPKGVAGVKKMIDAINAKETLGMLIDQKMNQGETLKFFGLDAKTTTLPAKLAIKHKLPVYMVCFERTKGAYFRLSFEQVHYTENENANELMQRINNVLELWVRRNPSQWFWVHKRWG